MPIQIILKDIRSRAIVKMAPAILPGNPHFNIQPPDRLRAPGFVPEPNVALSENVADRLSDFGRMPRGGGFFAVRLECLSYDNNARALRARNISEMQRGAEIGRASCRERV